MHKLMYALPSHVQSHRAQEAPQNSGPLLPCEFEQLLQPGKKISKVKTIIISYYFLKI